MSLPWHCGAPLTAGCFAAVVRRAIFDCCKWHTQVQDRPVLCPYPLVLPAAIWEEVARLAAALAHEAMAAEAELLARPELHVRLGLPAALRRALRQAGRAGPAVGGARVIRFDFHWTTEGWRISEANADVAGGFIESSGVAALVAEHYPGLRTPGDPAGTLVDAISALVAGKTVALMHLTVYTEDRQGMLYLAQRLGERGVAAILCDAGQLRWENGRAMVCCPAHRGPVGLVFRYFPAEWLPRLPRASGWPAFFAGARTPVSNPGQAVLTQSKRFPLTWDRLTSSLPVWRALLPETRSPEEHDWDDPGGWVLKPALGHEGHNIGLSGVTPFDAWETIRRAARRDPGVWVAQRRFHPLPLDTPDGTQYPTLGVYVIDGQVAGAYGRMAPWPLTDDRAREMAVLIDPSNDLWEREIRAP